MGVCVCVGGGGGPTSSLLCLGVVAFASSSLGVCVCVCVGGGGPASSLLCLAWWRFPLLPVVFDQFSNIGTFFTFVLFLFPFRFFLLLSCSSPSLCRYILLFSFFVIVMFLIVLNVFVSSHYPFICCGTTQLWAGAAVSLNSSGWCGFPSSSLVGSAVFLFRVWEGGPLGGAARPSFPPTPLGSVFGAVLPFPLLFWVGALPSLSPFEWWCFHPTDLLGDGAFSHSPLLGGGALSLPPWCGAASPSPPLSILL